MAAIRFASIFLGILLGLLLAATGASAGAIGFADAAGRLDLSGRVEFLRDRNGSLTLNDLAFGDAALDFVNPGALPNFGYTPDVIWVRITIRREAGRPDFFLMVGPRYLSELTLFVPNDPHPASAAAFRALKLAGGGVTDFPPYAASDRVFGLSQPQGSEQTYYLRVASLGPIPLTLSLQSAQVYARDSTTREMLDATNLGLHAAIFIMTVLFTLFVKEWIYALLAGYLAARMVFLFVLAGWTRLTLPGLTPAEFQTALSLSILFQIAFISLFLYALFNIRTEYPRTARVLVVCAATTTVLLIGWRFTGDKSIAKIGMSLCLFQIALLVFPCVDQLIRRTQSAIWYALALLPQVIPFAWLILIALGVAPAADDDLQIIGGLLLFVLAAALVDRFNRERAAAIAVIAAEGAEAREEQVRMIDMIAHQYRTPLATIRTTTESLMLTLSESDRDNRGRVERIRRAATRLNDLLASALVASHLADIAAKLSRQPIGIAVFLARLAQRARDAHAAVAFDLEIAPALAGRTIDADPLLIETAINNLVDNAAKFSAPGGHILLRAETLPTGLRLSVKDSGIGIPPEQLANVTRKYFRADNATGHPGMGMGLALVDRIARAHGGALSIDSEPGRGTTVALDLPFVAPVR